ncbi:translation initiation factor IF-3 [Candidatus Falkowbacteria bacterium]|nr:translation initiation factor IF-3 [Candidatus Falkowbacteria bacterium]
MRKAYKFKKRQRDEKNFSCNEQIRAPQVAVIDEDGVSLGAMPTPKALQLANERGYDLVEVSPLSNPPVAKLLNFGSFQYQREKQIKKQRLQSKGLDVKNIRISIKIGEHDRDVRISQADKFLAKGHKIKIELILKGREMQHFNLARDAMRSFQQALTEKTLIEQDVAKQGNKIFMILMPDRTRSVSKHESTSELN